MPILPFCIRYVSISFLSTLADDILRHTPSGILIIAESSSRIDPLRANENAEPGRKVLLRSPSNRSEGCSLSCCSAVTGERLAKDFLASAALLVVDVVLLVCCCVGGGCGATVVCCCTIGVDTAGVGVVLLPFDDDVRRDDELELFLEDLEDLFSFFSSGGGGCSTSRYIVEGRGNVSRAFCKADVKSLFSQKPDESIQYKFSSFFSSESFIEDILGISDGGAML